VVGVRRGELALSLSPSLLVSLSLPSFPGGKDQAERVISATELEKRITTLAPVVYQRGGLPRPFRENSSWERLGA
jgi:hypothetical protein